MKIEAIAATPPSATELQSITWRGDAMQPALREDFEAAMMRATALPADAPLIDVDAPASPFAGMNEDATDLADPSDDASAALAAWPVVAAVPIVPAPPAVDAPVAIEALAPVSATAAAAQRLQAAPVIDRSAPWRIGFGAREGAASGVAAMVVTPAAFGVPSALRVIVSAGLQAALSLRVEGLRARLVERGVRHGLITVSEQEGDDESQG